MALARAGCHVVTCGSRFAGNDTNLDMVKVARDLGSVVAHCYDELQYERVLLVGWSGGGSLSSMYQSIASSTSPPPHWTAPPVDGLVLMAAHASRALILTECLDPSVWLHRRDVSGDGSGDGGGDDSATRAADDGRPYDWDTQRRHLDVYGQYGNVPPPTPFTPAFLTRYRRGQHERSARITAWARGRVAAGRGHDCVVIEGTMADPRWLDSTCDPNDRPGTKPWCYLGDPRTANDSPVGLARFTTAKAWLSQWSFEDSPADGIAHVALCSDVPTLVVANGADDGCPPSHPRAVFEASGAADKTYVEIRHARHYYDGQPEKLVEAVGVVMDWLRERDFVDVAAGGGGDEGRGEGKAREEGEEREEAALARLRIQYDGSGESSGESGGESGGESKPMEINGINHVALVSSDMERTCRFYGGVLGMRLSKTISLPGGGQHFFFHLESGRGGADTASSLAFFFFKDAPPASPGVSAPSLRRLLETGSHPSAVGSMNHVSFNVPEERIYA